MELGLLPIRAGNSNVTVELPYQNFGISVSSVAFRVVGEGSYTFSIHTYPRFLSSGFSSRGVCIDHCGSQLIRHSTSMNTPSQQLYLGHCDVALNSIPTVDVSLLSRAFCSGFWRLGFRYFLFTLNICFYFVVYWSHWGVRIYIYGVVVNGWGGCILNSGIVEERSYCALFGMIIGGCMGGIIIVGLKKEAFIV
jgi:hypothetical protein